MMELILGRFRYVDRDEKERQLLRVNKELEFKLLRWGLTSNILDVDSLHYL